MFAYGFAQKHVSPKFTWSTNEIISNSSEKKIAELMYSRRFCFKEETLAENVKRYTNGHTRVKDIGGVTGAKCAEALARLFDILMDAVLATA